MSGGSYDYLYSRVEDMADRICDFADTPERTRFAELLRRVAKAMRAIEWVDSNDWGKGDENEAIRAVFDPSENDALDIAEAERRMIEAYDRVIGLQRLSDMYSGDAAGCPFPRAIYDAKEARAFAVEAWSALARARDAKGGGA